MASGRVYLSEQVIEALKDNPSALAEYLFHEANCEGENHYEIIAGQQRRFPENYEGRGYVFDEEKGYLIDPETGEIAKGLLKNVLRGEIDAQIKSEGFLYESVEEALEVYKQEHGEPGSGDHGNDCGKAS